MCGSGGGRGARYGLAGSFRFLGTPTSRATTTTSTMSDKAARTEDTDHRPRSWSLRRCLALALLLALTLILNFASSFAARSGTNVAWRRLSHAVTPLSNDPLKRARQLLDKQPVIGQSPLDFGLRSHSSPPTRLMCL